MISFTDVIKLVEDIYVYSNIIIEYTVSNIGFLINLSLIMIPFVISIDTLSSKEEYEEVHKKTRILILKKSSYLILYSIILFLMQYIEFLFKNSIFKSVLWFSQILIIILIINILWTIVCYIRDEIERFKNFQ